MPTSKQQQAKQMSQQWSNKIPQSTDRTGDFNQDYIDVRSNQTQQKQKANDDYLYNRQLNDMSLWAQRSESNQINRERVGREADQKHSGFDYNAQLWQRDRAGSKSAGSSGTAFGEGAPPPSSFIMNERGQSFYRPGIELDWRRRQDQVLNDKVNQAKRMSDIEKEKQDYFNKTQYTQNVDMMNRQASLDAQKTGQDKVFQAQEAAKDRESRQQLAMTQAYSFNPGQYQYWGGRV